MTARPCSRAPRRAGTVREGQALPPIYSRRNVGADSGYGIAIWTVVGSVELPSITVA